MVGRAAHLSGTGARLQLPLVLVQVVVPPLGTASDRPAHESPDFRPDGPGLVQQSYVALDPRRAALDQPRVDVDPATGAVEQADLVDLDG